MIKILQLGSTIESTGEVRVSLITDALVKTAANSIQQHWASMDRKPDKAYLHVLAMTSIGWYACNNNGDAFHEVDLKQYHPVFVEQAHLFMHHMNKDPKKSVGTVVYSFFNDDMHRVELIIEVDKAKGPAIVKSIENNEPIAVSMGVRVAYDVCSICGNKAKTRKDYCDHLKYNMKKILPDGRQVYAVNPGPLKFFDISIVSKPADRTAWALQKAASENSGIATVKTSAELGEEYADTQTKLAALKKLSEIVKEVDGIPLKAADGDKTFNVHRYLKNNDVDFDFPQVPFKELSKADADPGALLAKFMQAGVFPSLHESAFIIGRKYLGDALEEHHLPMLVRSIGPCARVLERDPGVMDDLVSGIIQDAVSAVQQEPGLKISINIEPVARRRRAMLMAMMTPEMEKAAGDVAKTMYIPNRLPVNTGKSSVPSRVRMGAYNMWSTSGPPASEEFTVTGTDGKKYRTTRGAARTAANAENIPDMAKAMTSAGLALAAFGAAGARGDLATKMIATPILAALALGMYPNKRDTIETDQGVEVPVSSFFTQVKEAAVDPKLIVPALGAAVPAALGLDYVYNSKIRNKKDPYYQQRMGFVGRTADKAGRFVLEHPLLSVSGGAVAASMGKHRLASRMLKNNG